MNAPYSKLLGPDPRTTFLLALVDRKRTDFTTLSSVELDGLRVVVMSAAGVERFEIPPRWHTDVARMEDVLSEGMSFELEQHISRVLGHD